VTVEPGRVEPGRVEPGRVEPGRVEPGRAEPGPLEPGAEDAAKTFEQLLAELEDVTDRLAGGELGIEAATDLYEQAERLHGLASARLAQVQERVDRLRADAAPPAP
jgi:exodeoxyribonuclease VII small subunit